MTCFFKHRWRVHGAHCFDVHPLPFTRVYLECQRCGKRKVKHLDTALDIVAWNAELKKEAPR